VVLEFGSGLRMAVSGREQQNKCQKKTAAEGGLSFFCGNKMSGATGNTKIRARKFGV
jgi:hypothetical protein